MWYFYNYRVCKVTLLHKFVFITKNTPTQISWHFHLSATEKGTYYRAELSGIFITYPQLIVMVDFTFIPISNFCKQLNGDNERMYLLLTLISNEIATWAKPSLSCMSFSNYLNLLLQPVQLKQSVVHVWVSVWYVYKVMLTTDQYTCVPFYVNISRFIYAGWLMFKILIKNVVLKSLLSRCELLSPEYVTIRDEKCI